MAKDYDQLRQEASFLATDQGSLAPTRDSLVDHLDSHDAGTLLVRVEQVAGLPDAAQPGRLFFSTTVGLLYLDDGVQVKLVDTKPSWTEGAAPESDFYPTKDDQFIGDESYPVRGVAVGRVTADPVNDLGLQGAILDRTDIAPGAKGLYIVGLADSETRNAADVEPNVPVQISGSTTVITGPMIIEVQQPLNEDHYLIVGPSSVGADGKNYSPVAVGPEIVYSATDEATDANDYNLDGVGGEQPIVSMVLANDYAAQVSTFTFRVVLSEESSQGRTALFTVHIYVNSVEAYTVDASRAGTTELLAETLTLQSPLSTGDTIEMRVSAVDTHPQTDPWVRGTVQESVIRMSR